MSDTKTSTSKKDNSEDKGTLEKMNESNATKEQESTTGTAKDEGTLGKMNGKAEIK